MSDPIRPTLNFTLICDDVRQETGGKISLMGLFENLYALRFPVIHPRLVIFNEWVAGRGEFTLRTAIVSGDRREVLRETSSKIRLNDVKQKHRDVSIHLNIEFREHGTYWVDCYLDEELMGSSPLTVSLVKEQSVH